MPLVQGQLTGQMGTQIAPAPTCAHTVSLCFTLLHSVLVWMEASQLRISNAEVLRCEGRTLVARAFLSLLTGTLLEKQIQRLGLLGSDPAARRNWIESVIKPLKKHNKRQMMFAWHTGSLLEGLPRVCCLQQRPPAHTAVPPRSPCCHWRSWRSDAKQPFLTWCRTEPVRQKGQREQWSQGTRNLRVDWWADVHSEEPNGSSVSAEAPVCTYGS